MWTACASIASTYSQVVGRARQHSHAADRGRGRAGEPAHSLPRTRRLHLFLALRSLRSVARRLMGEEDPFAGDDILTVDGMTINLATYQVYLDDEPVDLTLMEYSCYLSWPRTQPCL